MNKKIKELALQANVLMDFGDDITVGRYSIGGSCEQMEEFAKLIIRKCAKVADLADENKCEWIGGNILNHFGVEE
jgi:hypothetical protein